MGQRLTGSWGPGPWQSPHCSLSDLRRITGDQCWRPGQRKWPLCIDHALPLRLPKPACEVGDWAKPKSNPGRWLCTLEDIF